MKAITGKRIYVNLMISVIISLFMVLPMLLGMLGYDIFNRRPAEIPSFPRWITLLNTGREFLLYFIMIFTLLTINTLRSELMKGWHKILAGFGATIIFFLIFQLFQPGPHATMPPMKEREPKAIHATAERPAFPKRPEQVPGNGSFTRIFFDMRRMTEFIFIFITTVLIGKVFDLIRQKQQVELENEQLRAENLQNRYNALLEQINPHFFFNSLNSLSSLVREGRNDNAIEYIEELSNTYRYVMQSSRMELVTVDEEVESLKAYCYLLQIRYEDKLFFEINIALEAGDRLLPVLSLQPLIENVVKHNVISSSEPLTVTITGSKEGIAVINPIIPRQEITGKSGTGLKNLSTRYKLLTGKDILVENDGRIFSVTLPLTDKEEV